MKQNGQATLKDVALKAGLSVMTVSNFVNGASVLEKNAQAIKRSIRELGYSLNQVAKSLRSRKSMTVGALISVLNDPYSSSILHAAERELAKHDYGMIVCDYNYDRELLKNRADFLFSKRVDGLLAMPPDHSDGLLYELQHIAPLVTLDYQYAGFAGDMVHGQTERASFEMTADAIARGHRRIGVVAGRAQSGTSTNGLAGYRQALAQFGIPYEDALVAYGNYDEADAYRAVDALMSSSNPPTMLYVFSYTMMLGLLRFMDGNKLRIGEDLSVMALDMLHLYDAVFPKIHCTDQDLEETGQEAARLLIRRMEGDRGDFPARMEVPYHIREGGSLRTIEARDLMAPVV